jgi:hypothetical protein
MCHSFEIRVQKISRLGASLGYLLVQPGLAPKRLIQKLGYDKVVAIHLHRDSHEQPSRSRTHAKSRLAIG